MGKKEVESFIKKANTRFPLEFAVLFGSRARGDNLMNSDYDILLVSDSFSGMDIFSRMRVMLDLWGGKEAIEPVCFTLTEFENALGTYNAIVWMSLKEGVPIFGEKKFSKYKKVFEQAVKAKDIVISHTIRFNKEPEKIFGIS